METTQPFPQLLRRLWYHFPSRRRIQFGFLLALTIVASFAEVLSIGAVLPFLAALTEPQRIFGHPLLQPLIRWAGFTSAEELLLPLTVIFAIAAILAGAIRMSLLWASVRFSFKIGSELSVNVYRRTLYQSYATHISRNSSEVINVIWVKVSEVIFYIFMPGLTLISSGVMVVAIVIALFYVIPGVALALMGGFALLYALIIKTTRGRVRRDSQKIARESNNMIKNLQEGLGGIRDVLIDGSQESFCAIYQHTNHVLRRAQGNNQIISQGPRAGMEVLGIIMIATLAYILSRQPGGVAHAIPILAALALGLQRLLPALQQAYYSLSTIQGAQASLQDTLTLLDQELPVHAGEQAASRLPFNDSITLKKISFRYTAQTPWILEDLDLVIRKGSRIGFIGGTGSGKSTLLDIVMGLLQPISGTMEIDHQPISIVNCRSWQAHIAHVPQSVFLTDNTILENIAFGVEKSSINMELVMKAARQAQIADMIDAWPLKYQTAVGERGVQLSGGQRQRIGIARALYKQADVIIFDEATSALDTETEEAVMQAIEALDGNITILIIAHRLNTLRNCNKIIKLGNRRIIDENAPIEMNV